MTLLETKQDFEWLSDVYGIDKNGAVEVAILRPSESNVEFVELYTQNHIDCKPIIINVNKD